MSTRADPIASEHRSLATNPFSTRWTRPGALPFVFRDAMTVDAVVERIAQHDWRGAIIGPHGTGKTTLLETLIPALARVGRRPMLVTLRDKQRRLPLTRAEWTALPQATILVIDGFQQLSRWQRGWLLYRCRRHRYGLLVTTHASCGFPAVYSTAPDLRLVEHLIQHHLPRTAGYITRRDLAVAWQRHAPNVREVLFALYDTFESKRRQRT